LRTDVAEYTGADLPLPIRLGDARLGRPIEKSTHLGDAVRVRQRPSGSWINRGRKSRSRRPGRARQ
jgi:hypothetical protein